MFHSISQGIDTQCFAGARPDWTMSATGSREPCVELGLVVADDFRRRLETNLFGMIEVCRAVVPEMARAECADEPPLERPSYCSTVTCSSQSTRLVPRAEHPVRTRRSRLPTRLEGTVLFRTV